MTKRAGIEELELALSRKSAEAYREKKRADNYYNQLRRLENRVRKTIVVGEHIDTDELYALRISVPRNPRPTLTELRKGIRRRLTR